MTRLFIDVDDTLIRWIGGHEPHPYGFGADRWEVNEDVAEMARYWVARGDELIIWSGGGMYYAGEWGCRVLPDLARRSAFKAMSKDPSLVAVGDFVCDDDLSIFSRGWRFLPSETSKIVHKEPA